MRLKGAKQTNIVVNLKGQEDFLKKRLDEELRNEKNSISAKKNTRPQISKDPCKFMIKFRTFNYKS